MYRLVYLIVFMLLGSVALAQQTPRLEVKLQGVRGALYDNVMNTLSVVREHEHPRLSERRIQSLHAKAEAEIRHVLEPFGYYQVQITSTLQAIPCQLRSSTENNAAVSCDRPQWRAEYHIELGPALKVSRLDVQIHGAADIDPAFQTWRKAFPLQVGDTLEHASYEQAKRSLLGLAQARGYFQAKLVKSEIRLDLAAYQAEIVLHLVSGLRYRFGKVDFEQEPAIFATEFLARFVNIHSGDPFDEESLLALRNEFTGSEYFADANLEVDTENLSDTQPTVPVKVHLEPRKPNQYSAGIGYGTDTGVRGSLGWDRRYLNRYGHRFSTNVEASGGSGDNLNNRRLKYSATYFIPVGHPNRKYLAFNLGLLDEVNNTGESQTGLLSAAYHRPQQIPWLWGGTLALQETLALEYRYERFTLGGDTDRQTTALLMPNAEWMYLQADDRVYPHHGQKVTLGLRGASASLGSEVSFAQLRLAGALIRGLSKRTRILTRAEIGYSVVDGFADLPPSQRFFAGGDRNVRGYRYQSLGEIDDTGVVVGGKHTLVGSVEFDYRFLDKWSAAIFYDAGNAFNAFSTKLEHGAGVGVRWFSPIGPVRLDLATPLNADDVGVQVHITIGPDL